MGSVKHTPGPWNADSVNSWNVWAADCKVADAGDPLQAASYREPSKEERIANARLIAAAPDLLEALEEFSRVYDGFQDGDGNPCPTLAKARTAIARATGEGEA